MLLFPILGPTESDGVDAGWVQTQPTTACCRTAFCASALKYHLLDEIRKLYSCLFQLLEASLGEQPNRFDVSAMRRRDSLIRLGHFCIYLQIWNSQILIEIILVEISYFIILGFQKLFSSSDSS